MVVCATNSASEHAEAALLRKWARMENNRKIDVIVIRITSNGVGESRPCPGCCRILLERSGGLRTVSWSSPGANGTGIVTCSRSEKVPPPRPYR